jgi:hypothetical protein
MACSAELGKELAGAPLQRRRRLGCVLSPPEGFFGFVDNVAPGQADVMEIAIGPLGEFTTGAVTLPPGVESLAQLVQNARNMMICHRFMGAGGHFQLLKLIFELQYLGYRAVSQTTLCTASDEINS